jgi:hypothetical protein
MLKSGWSRNKFNKSQEKYSFLETDNISSSQEISRVLLTPKVHYRVQ